MSNRNPDRKKFYATVTSITNNNVLVNMTGASPATGNYNFSNVDTYTSKSDAVNGKNPSGSLNTYFNTYLSDPSVTDPVLQQQYVYIDPMGAQISILGTNNTSVAQIIRENKSTTVLGYVTKADSLRKLGEEVLVNIKLSSNGLLIKFTINFLKKKCHNSCHNKKFKLYTLADNSLTEIIVNLNSSSSGLGRPSGDQRFNVINVYSSINDLLQNRRSVGTLRLNKFNLNIGTLTSTSFLYNFAFNDGSQIRFGGTGQNQIGTPNMPTNTYLGTVTQIPPALIGGPSLLPVTIGYTGAQYSVSVTSKTLPGSSTQVYEYDFVPLYA